MSAHDDALLADVRQLHEEIRAAVAGRLAAARAAGGHELASRPVAWGAGDRTYALDEAAHVPLQAFVDRVGARRPVVMVAEGPGELRAAPDVPTSSDGDPVRVLVDPVDGTRPLMLDMRSAWVLTGIAPDLGADSRLSQVELAVQTELPTTNAAVYHVMVARRGQGATLARHDVTTGEVLEQGPLRVADDLPLDNGFFSFNRYLPVERAHVVDIERRFLESAIAGCNLDPHLLYDDQYLCTAGQLFLMATGRYRMLADLRGWLGRTRGLANFPVKPYDLSSSLIFEEAGVPLLDAEGRPFDGPMDTETGLDLVAYGNATIRDAFAPHLRHAMDA
jgi:hypothetical protein